jgi:hypothetical protein
MDNLSHVDFSEPLIGDVLIQDHLFPDGPRPDREEPAGVSAANPLVKSYSGSISSESISLVIDSLLMRGGRPDADQANPPAALGVDHHQDPTGARPAHQEVTLLFPRVNDVVDSDGERVLEYGDGFRQIPRH